MEYSWKNTVDTTLKVPSTSHRSARAKPSNNIQHIPSGSLDRHRDPMMCHPVKWHPITCRSD